MPLVVLRECASGFPAQSLPQGSVLAPSTVSVDTKSIGYIALRGIGYGIKDLNVRSLMECQLGLCGGYPLQLYKIMYASH